MRALDSNVLLRALLADDPRQTALAQALLTSGEKLLVPITVLLEVGWVLRHQGMARAELARVLRSLASSPCIELDEPEKVAAAIALFIAGADLGDALHIACAKDASPLLTFDRDFARRANKTARTRAVELLR